MTRTHVAHQLSAVCVLGLALLAVSCASAPPRPEELAGADYGSPITQEDAQASAQAFLKRHLKDPSSAQVDWGGVNRGWMREAPIHGNKLRFGYMLTASVNAKNSFGAYTGYKPYQFFFFNGALVSVYAEQENRGTTYMGKIY